MNLKILWGFAAMLVLISAVNGQSARARILDAYFDALVEQQQVDANITTQLQGFSPELRQQYQELIASTAQEDALLQWTYFYEKLERKEGGPAMAELCHEGHRTNNLIRFFHSYQIVDPYSQTVVDTSQSTRRLLFFDIEEGQKVAEIGFGYGYNLNLLAIPYEQLTVYANELNAHQLQNTAQRLQENFPAGRRDNFHFILGAVNSTNLEGQDLDLIIMENVLHHITDKRAFLASLAESIQEKGTIVIIEEFRGVRPGGKICPDLMYRPELSALLKEAGFQQVEAQDLEGQYKTMLRFVKNEGPVLEK